MEEFCSGTCREFQYDAYQRLIVPEKDADVGTAAVESSGKGRRKTKKKIRRKKKRSKSAAPTSGQQQMPL